MCSERFCNYHISEDLPTIHGHFRLLLGAEGKKFINQQANDFGSTKLNTKRKRINVTEFPLSRNWQILTPCSSHAMFPHEEEKLRKYGKMFRFYLTQTVAMLVIKWLIIKRSIYKCYIFIWMFNLFLLGFNCLSTFKM